ncbi:MAG TPA: glycosyltransferase [Saprospiraceae bacterium]|nr:glycosyltransferase [Saprospiraceae bacterium]
MLTTGPGVDIGHFSPRAQSPGHTFTFLFPARLLAEKGVREYAQAAALLKRSGLRARFQVLGNTDSGNPTSISKTELENWVAAGSIEYLGFTDDVRAHLAEADVVVLPSYYREGVPRCLLEAMSMQKPILTTDSVGCRETVDVGKNGLLIVPRDAQALADAMRQLALLPRSALHDMGLHSRQKVLSTFSDEVVLPQLLALMQEVLRENTTA